MFWFIIFENTNHINDSEVDKITHRCTYITCTYVQNVSLNDTKSVRNRIRKINLCVRVLLCTSALYYFCVNPEFSFKVFNITRLRTPLICLSVCPSVRPSVWLSVCLSAHLCACLSVRPSVWLSVCRSVRSSVCLSSYPTIFISFIPFIYSSFFLSLFLTSPHDIVIAINKMNIFLPASTAFAFRRGLLQASAKSGNKKINRKIKGEIKRRS